jgi:hypothetical protein
MIEDQRWPDLADRRRAEATGARRLQDGFFVQIIAAEMLIDVAQHRIVFDEGDDGVAGGRGGITGKDRVAEGPGIAQMVAGRHARRIGHGERRK